ncbi:MAG: cysteine desulfurase [Thermoplasmataceae archaeon]
MIYPERIKRDFPIFKKLPQGYSYLDNAATTQKPYQVIDAISSFYTEHNSNVHRGIYRLSEEATDIYWKSRENISRFIGAHDATGLVFTRNTTESINLLAYTLARNMKKDDRVLLSVMEHHSNIVPWQIVSQVFGLGIDYVDIGPEGQLDMQDLENKISKKTKIVSLAHSSNVLGTINPVEEITKIAHDNGSIMIVDGAQSVPHMPVDVERIGCDFLAFSGHKMLGPMGIGGLYGRPELLEDLPPFMGGGEMIREVYLDHSVWAEIPDKFEAGTPNVAGAVGLSAAVDYLRNIGMENIREHEKRMIAETLRMENESDIGILKSYGPRRPEIRGGVYSFNLGEIPPLALEDHLHNNNIGVGTAVHPHDVATGLDKESIAIRSGHHCAMPLMHRLNVIATSRASFYIYNGIDEIAKLFSVLESLGKEFA